MASIKPYNDYMESLAQLVLGHNPANRKQWRFAVLGIEEIVSQAASGLGAKDKFVMILEAVEVALTVKSESKNPMMHLGAFHVVRYAPPQDFVQQKEVQERAFELGMEVIFKMQRDFKNRFLPGSPLVDKFWDDFNFGDIRCHKVGPLMDNLHGYRFTFNGNKHFYSVEPTPTLYQDYTAPQPEPEGGDEDE